MKMKVDEIRIRPRHRRDMGDIDGLADSIREVGLLHPIVVNKNGTLIAGERRIKAVEALGWRDIPVHIVEIDKIARGEAHENFNRKDFTPSEAVSIKRELEPEMKAAAKERQGTRTDKHPANFAESSRGDARKKTAAFTGRSYLSLDKAEAIVKAAEAEPEKFGKILEDMDRTGRVNGPFKRLKVIKQSESIRLEPPPLPNHGPYRVIAADPPWPYEIRKDDPSHRGTHPYPQMSIADVCALKVATIAHDDCLLWLWTTNHHMREALGVLDAWGFQQKTILTWVKDKMGLGDWLRGQTEHCLLATRGKPIVQLTNQTTVLHAPSRAHSQKPVEFYEFVEKLCPASRYAELFQREARPNWDGHGDEVPK
jgi:N6-adenosine-specific RNA methylase IME4